MPELIERSSAAELGDSIGWRLSSGCVPSRSVKREVQRCSLQQELCSPMLWRDHDLFIVCRGQTKTPYLQTQSHDGLRPPLIAP